MFRDNSIGQIKVNYVVSRLVIITNKEVKLLSLHGIKARLHRRFLSQQLNAIFVAPKLQLQNRTCKPLCDFGAILAIYRRGMRYNSRNTVTLSSSFTF